MAPGEPIPGIPEPVWGIAAALETFDSPIPMEETAARYGVSLRQLEILPGPGSNRRGSTEDQVQLPKQQHVAMYTAPEAFVREVVLFLEG